jgi:dipeptidyl aminopeptidase/acylaminoacyl peptidase
VSEVTQHFIEQGDGARVELFQSQPPAARNGAILFVHGNQGGLLLGAKEFVDNGSLVRFSSRLGITAAAVSQPGFGASDGPPDFCGPATQQAIIAALAFLEQQPMVDPDRIVLYGNSRGAVASAMVATKIQTLRALILSSGVYDLQDAYDRSSRGLQHTIEAESGATDRAFSDRSALFYADRITAETLLLHGLHDDRAPIDQAERLSAALAKAGVPVNLQTFDAGHRLSGALVMPTLKDFLTRIFRPAVTLH